MKNVIENLAALGRRRLVILGLTGLGVLLAIGVGLSVAMAPTYRPLVTDATAATGSQIFAELERAGLAPRISNDGTMISLPEADIPQARMALAEAGLPPADTAGWSLFDNVSAIGMNSFLQRVNRLRALEGELTRSIKSLDIVEDARVHLVLPERETFSQERPEASASVIVRTRPGRAMERRQALAIRSLVAAAVPDLDPGRVTVLSASGQTILAEEGTEVGIGDAQLEIEERLRRNIESILGAHVGAENVRVRVTAELDSTRRVVVQESFDPDTSVPRTITSSSEESRSNDADPGAVDVANNLATINPAGGGGGSSESRSRQSEERQFSIGSVRSEQVTEAGGIKRLTVAAVINGIWDGTTYQERSPQELERLASLVRTAAGIDQGRGDLVTVESFRFAENLALLEGESGGLSELLALHLGTIVRALIGLTAVSLVLLLAVRPALKQLSAPREAEASGGLPALGGLGDEPMAMAVAGPMAMGSAFSVPDGTGFADGPQNADDFVSFSSFSGNVMRQYVDDFSHLVETEPEASMRTIRAWINQKG
ncbi:MAG: flagellar basal-body MS-ring/collar protein FliF [Pelagibaca sp.]